MNNELYLLKFDPILKEKIWGGSKLNSLFNKKTKSNKTGESWEISDHEDDISIVSNGPLKGKSLQYLLKEYKEELVGKEVFKNFGIKFPLLIKYIDAAENLSIQLHPNDKIAKEKHNSFGKTEMWYIMQADKDAELILGFKEPISKAKYVELVEQNKLPDSLNKVKVKVGDAFIIPPGLVHAIGKGVVLAEIQQTSDVTYRIYDWDRKSETGEKRELHTALALEAIDLSSEDGHKIDYTIQSNTTSKIIATNYFKTNIIAVDGEINEDYSEKDCFIILMGIEGESIISLENGNSEILKPGETLLIPASKPNIKINSSGAKILEVSV
ncbi:mannose-6-phosphate isomerase type 1 [Gillisia mitskevichiae]|uniref:Phosphohexomutase n=1 Tax=Gillisia mitskevichiae TaxID=270921 RepID=A0A495PTC1_9FLAO|nr:type I phosphomannose isomerase catalytic subunit [Gillisia mitskevichiae]RKS53854.1 mannose-6-phosphate isomerase type 1 [Gillisia mitskevichiae]